MIHVRRHSCAVVASLLAADWHWSFERVRLSEVLPAVADAIPREFDEDAVSRISACWALTEAHVARALHDKPWARLVTYEDAVENPSAMFRSLCLWTNRRQVRTAAFDRPSASIHPNVFTSPSRTHHDRWRRSLSEVRVARIEYVADRLYPSWRDVWA